MTKPELRLRPLGAGYFECVFSVANSRYVGYGESQTEAMSDALEKVMDLTHVAAFCNEAAKVGAG